MLVEPFELTVSTPSELLALAVALIELALALACPIDGVAPNVVKGVNDVALMAILPFLSGQNVE
jgi:hypothetical protein